MTTLYKKTPTGKIEQWSIKVIGDTIYTEYGQVNGKLIQTQDTIKNGKGLDTIRETTPSTQAVLEARAKHIKQLKKGYVDSIEKALAGDVDAVIQGGVVPMLAKKYDEDGHHIEFPCAVQPKLDGMRAIYQEGKLWSRTRKEIGLLSHITESLDTSLILDGELYNHELKEHFEDIIAGARRTKTESDKSQDIQYHVYDVIIDKPFNERMKLLQSLSLPKNSPIKIVETRVVETEQQLMQVYEEFLDKGYEGAMARNLNSPYENKRSKHLQKLKTFQDSEFKVVGIEEGRGKLKGHVGAFVCEICDKEGTRQFKAKPEGKQGFLKDCFTNPELWKNKLLTVRYQGYTNKNKVPRFPVGVRFRSDV